MKVRYTTRARNDLQAIFAYLFQRNQSAARRVRVRIKDVAARISELPAKGRIVEQRRGVRRVSLTRYPYAIYYARDKKAIVILHIRHSAQKPPDSNQFGW